MHQWTHTESYKAVWVALRPGVMDDLGWQRCATRWNENGGERSQADMTSVWESWARCYAGDRDEWVVAVGAGLENEERDKADVDRGLGLRVSRVRIACVATPLPCHPLTSDENQEERLGHSTQRT